MIIGLNAYTRNEVRSQINRLKFYFKKLENWIETESQIKQNKGNNKEQSRNQWHGNQKNNREKQIIEKSNGEK